MIPGRRPAIASVAGMLFMAMVFLIAIGAQVYIANAQGAAQAGEAQAQQRLIEKGQESIAFEGGPVDPRVTNTGATTVTVVAMLMRFGNGSVIDLNETSSPPLGSVSLLQGASAWLESMVPVGDCSPGVRCLSVYLAIVGGTTEGQAIGVVTSTGNLFWFVPGASAPGGQGPTAYWTSDTESTSSLNYTRIPGLSFTGGPGSLYEVEVRVGFWNSAPSPNPGMFAIGVSNGTSFMFCGGLDWSNPSGSYTDLAPGNACSSSPGESLGSTWSQSYYCNSRQAGCELVGTAYVDFGPTGGSFDLEFRGQPSGASLVFQDSVLIVSQLQ